MINNFWFTLSNLGINDQQSELEKHMIILTNRINFLIGFIMLGLFIFITIILGAGILGYSTIRLGIISFICALNLYFAYKGLFCISKLSLTIVVPFFILLFNLFFERVENEYFTYYTYAAISLSVIPWLIFSNKKEKIPLYISVIYIGLIVLFMDRILLYFSNTELPIYRIIISFYPFYKIAQIAIYLFLNLTFIYILRLNRAYQEKLENTNKLLTDQSHEIKEQANHLQYVNQELEKLSLVASKTDNAVTILKPDGKIEWINEGFTQLYGYELSELIEKKGDNFIDILEEDDLKLKYQECIRSRKSKTCESTITTKNGEKLWRQTTLTPILNNDGSIHRLIAIDSDITALKKAEEKIHLLLSEIGKQRDLAVEQRDEIMDSINYAERIQKALLPSNNRMNALLNEYFVLNFPKSIVSGDFYWIAKKGDLTILALSDCTGHGVSGAFMSIIGSHLLDSIVNRNRVTKPSEILKILNRKLKITLHTKDYDKTHDGMDIAIITIDNTTQSIEFAGAMRPIVYFHKNELNIIKGDYMQITSDVDIKQNKKFVTHTIQLRKGDIIYLFSDGIVDQFGGQKGKKLYLKGFKKWLTEIYMLPLEQQEKELFDRLNKWWKGSYEQVDDILVLAIKL